MKLATLDDGTRDGRLIVVTRDGTRYAPARSIAATLQAALDSWHELSGALAQLSHDLAAGRIESQPLSVDQLLAPLPRAYEWVDGSAYLNHARLVRKARGAELPPSFTSEPLVYQGGSGALLAGHAAIPLPNAEWGLDFEGETCVVLDDVARGTSAKDAEKCVRLLMVANDLSYRNLVPAELAKGFGFFTSKPATSFAPFAVTPDDLGSSWRGGRLHGELRCYFNGRLVGSPKTDVGMHFSFLDLIAHIAKTRDLTAGTIVGSGTVSNEDPTTGACCIAELRARETLAQGSPETPYLTPGDSVRIEFVGGQEKPFGSIEQEVTQA